MMLINRQSILPLKLLTACVFIVALAVNHNAQASVWADYSKVGEARLKVLFWHIYTAHLYTPSGKFQAADKPLVLRIVYARDIEAKELVEHTQKQWDKIFGRQPEHAQWLTMLEKLWPDIKEGDELSLQLLDNRQCHFYTAAQALGAIDDQALCQAFLAIWLSDKVSDMELRNKLIGKA